MVVNDHNWLLITWLMWWQLIPELLEKVGAVLLVGRLGSVKVDEARDASAQGSNQGDGAATSIRVHHRNGFMWLLPATKCPFGYAPQVYTHLVKVNNLSLINYPLS